MARQVQNAEASDQGNKTKRKTSVISRLAASTALLAAAVVLIAVIFVQAIHGNLFESAFSQPLEEWSGMLSSKIMEDPDLASAAALNHRMGIVVKMPDRTLAFGPLGDPIDPELLLSHAEGFRRIDVTGHLGQEITFFLERDDFATDHLLLVLGLIGFLLLTIALVYFVQLSQLRPLQWLRTSVDAVSRGDFSTRVPVVRKDEIGQVAQAFNQMTGRVKQMMDDRERLLADVSHELRSPIARIKVALELIPENDKQISIARDVREMESLTRVLLERERVRMQVERAQLEPVDLNLLIQQSIESFDNPQPAIGFEPVENMPLINADPALLKIVINNLLDNALKFSTKQSDPVQVTLAQRSGGVEIAIRDHGIGIDPEQIGRIFEPFVKLDPARGHHMGYGLGLDLCQRIADIHKGSINVDAQPGNGSCFTLRLPESVG